MVEVKFLSLCISIVSVAYAVISALFRHAIFEDWGYFDSVVEILFSGVPFVIFYLLPFASNEVYFH